MAAPRRRAKPGEAVASGSRICDHGAVTVDREAIEAALPGYEVGEELGRGSCGVVVTATHRHLGRTVAIKELPPAFAANVEVRARFTSEAKLLASFDHPHIVPIYDYVEQAGVCLLVMEHMPGGTVWSRFAAEGFRFESSIAIALATALALHYAHDRQVLHRDIKPDNLLFSKSGALKVSDFGLAKVMGGAATMMTRTGQVLGTPAYIAPEQAQGNPVTPATDVYSLGIVLYELLSGDLPFVDDGNPVTMLLHHMNDQPRPLTELAPDVPPALAEVVMRALDKDPEQRWKTAWAFAAALAYTANSLWGPTWVDRSTVPLELPDKLSVRQALKAVAPVRVQEPVRRAASTPDQPRRSRRITTSSGQVAIDPATGEPVAPNAAPVPDDLSVDDVVPLEEAVPELLPDLSDAPPPVAPPGWHADPWGKARLRWWDGQRWTHHTS
jgi:serine/threonine protein kinase